MLYWQGMVAAAFAAAALPASAELMPTLSVNAGVNHIELRREQRDLDQNRGGRVLDDMDTRLSGEALTLGGELSWAMLSALEAYTSATISYTNQAETQIELATFQNGDKYTGNPKSLKSLTVEQTSAGLRWQQPVIERLKIQASVAVNHNVWRSRQQVEELSITVDGNTGGISQFVVRPAQTAEASDSFVTTHLQAALSYAFTRDLDARLSVQLQKGDEYEGAFAGLGVNYRL